MKTTFRTLLTLLAAALALPMAAQGDDHDFRVMKNIDVFCTIYKNLDQLYVDTLDADRVVGTGIAAMLQSLDPYTEYYPEEEQRGLRMMLTGKYAGIGAQIRYNFQLQRVCIDEPIEGMPAAEAGLRKGDIILDIDGEDMTGRQTDYVSEHLRGDAGTTFVLRVKRPSTGKVIKAKITRRTIQQPAVPYYGRQANGLGYISLTQFTEGCGKTFRNAVIDMRRQGIKGLVVDLRGNGGGAELEAVNVVNTFVPRGRVVVSNRSRNTANDHDYRTQVEPVDTVMPVVVLVNSNTASASEITAGALQDMDRAVIMGTKTFGKGIVQTVIQLPYNGQMKLTTNKYYIPSGRCIQRLTYRHDGGEATEAAADSTTRTFHTAAGRPVKEAGGITPDVTVAPDSLANITYYLTAVRDSDELAHNFAVDYIARHAQIAPAADFHLTDEDWAEFRRRVLASHFHYDPISEKALDNLEKTARFEGYYDGAKAEFDALRAKLKHNLAHDLDLHQQDIREMLEADIVAAYYYQRGAIANSLRHDKQVQAAYDLLLNQEKYRETLSGK